MAKTGQLHFKVLVGYDEEYDDFNCDLLEPKESEEEIEEAVDPPAYSFFREKAPSCSEYYSVCEEFNSIEIEDFLGKDLAKEIRETKKSKIITGRFLYYRTDNTYYGTEYDMDIEFDSVEDQNK